MLASGLCRAWLHTQKEGPEVYGHTVGGLALKDVSLPVDVNGGHPAITKWDQVL